MGGEIQSAVAKLMIDIQGISSDPEFQALPPSEKIRAIASLDPEFARLDSTEQAKGLAQLFPSVASSANASLSKRGLTPEDVKAGRGVTSPDQISFAPPKQVNGGFLGGLTSNPIHALDAALDSAQQMTVMGTREPNAGDALNVVGAPNLAATARESYRRGAANQSTSDMYGQATQAAAIAGASMGASRVAPMLRGAASKQMGAVVDPSGTNALAPSVAQEMLDQGIVTRNPRDTIANMANGNVATAGAKLNAAVKSAGPLDAGDVVQKINETRAKILNPDSDGEISPDAGRIARRLDAYAVNSILKNAQPYADPDGNLVFLMDPEVARTIKNNFDFKKYAQGSGTPAAEAQGAVGDALRDTLNQDPNIASANADKSRAMTIRDDVAPKAAKDTMPTMGRVLRTVAAPVAAEVAGQAFGLGNWGNAFGALRTLEAVPQVVKIVRDAMTSPLWNTTSAVTKARLAAALAARDYTSVAAIATDIAGQRKDQPEQ